MSDRTPSDADTPPLTIRAEVLGVIFDLARETLTIRDGYDSHGWTMTPLPLEAEVRAALNKPKPELTW